jgi:hypothetical protein
MHGDIVHRKERDCTEYGENTVMDLKKMGCADLVTNYLLRFGVERIDFVNTVGAFELLKSRETHLLNQGLSGSQEGLSSWC